METRTAPPRLGLNVLIVMDRSPGFLEALRGAAACLPQIAHMTFTLLCCCPMRYWEHGGADSPEAKDEIERASRRQDEALDCAERCLNQASAILEQAGVPARHILTRIVTTQDSYVAAAMHELNQGQYSGVIVSRYHEDLINRLQRRGVTDIFRRIPNVEVWALDLKA